MTINFRTPDEPEVEGIDYDELDEIIQDAVSNDEGRLGPLSLQHYLLRRGWKISRVEAHDYPRPMERLAVHQHQWERTSGGLICITCGEEAYPTPKEQTP